MLFLCFAMRNSSLFLLIFIIFKSIFSLKKTVMKIRPQVNGPIDVGYGNYILTAPADRQGRKRRKKEGGGGEDGGGEDAQMRTERSRAVTGDINLVDGKYDVSDLLSSANTLTNPKVSKVQNKNTEL